MGMSTGNPVTGLCAIMDTVMQAPCSLSTGGPISHTESYCGHGRFHTDVPHRSKYPLRAIMHVRHLSGSTACFRCPLQGGLLRRRSACCSRAESQQRRPTPEQEGLLISDAQQPSSCVKEDTLTGVGTGVNGAAGSVDEDRSVTISGSGKTDSWGRYTVRPPRL